jgi:deoxyribodipyrimidine photolyase
MSDKRKFIYPDKPASVAKEDWNPLPRDTPSKDENSKVAEVAPTPTPDATKSSVSEPTPEQGLDRLKDFVQNYLDERTKKQNPEARKKLSAISAYKKIKKSA